MTLKDICHEQEKEHKESVEKSEFVTFPSFVLKRGNYAYFIFSKEFQEHFSS